MKQLNVFLISARYHSIPSIGPNNERIREERRSLNQKGEHDEDDKMDMLDEYPKIKEFIDKMPKMVRSMLSPSESQKVN